MNNDQINSSSLRSSAPTGVLGKLLTIAVGAALVVLAFMFSLLALVVVLVVGGLVFAYLKWKTRHLRRHLEEQMQQAANRQQPPSGQVIEGEVIGDAEYEARSAPGSRPASDLPAPGDSPHRPPANP